MIFGVSFVVSLSLMLITVMLVLSFSIPQKKPTESSAGQDTDVSLEGYLPTEAERKNILLIFCQEKTEDPFCYCLVSFSPAELSIYLADLPSYALLGDSSLTDAYRQGSSGYAAGFVSSFFEAPVGGYLRITSGGGKNIIDAFGGADVSFTEETEVGNYRFAPGDYHLDGEQLWQLMQKEGRTAEYLKAVLEKAVLADRYDEADGLFHVVMNNCDSKYTLQDYYGSKKALRYYLFSADRRVEAIPFEEEYREGALTYRPEWKENLLAVLF